LNFEYRTLVERRVVPDSDGAYDAKA
jgi:hypothetical protein